MIGVLPQPGAVTRDSGKTLLRILADRRGCLRAASTQDFQLEYCFAWGRLKRAHALLHKQ